MKKRIAIQLFGHMRSFRKTNKSFFENIVMPNQKNGYDVDIFIHTWDETDHSTITWHNKDGAKRGIELDDKTLNLIKEIYKPKDIIVEPQLEAPNYIITEKIASAPRSYRGVVNVAYTQYMSSQIRKKYAQKHDLSYDYVIVTRPDIMFHKPFDIDDFLRVYDEYKWDVPKNGLFYAHNFFARGNVEDKHLIGGSDIIFFGSENSIDLATSCYEDIQNKVINENNIEEDFYCFEIFWYNYWLKRGLEPIRIKYLQFSCFNIIRNEEEYEDVIEKQKDFANYMNTLKINAQNGFNENVKFKTKNGKRYKNRNYYKFLKEIYKILPYCFSYKKINRCNEKLKELSR